MTQEKIYQPLFSQTKISFFAHLIVLNDGGFNITATNDSWLKHFLRNAYYNNVYCLEHSLADNIRYYTWNNVPSNPLLRDTRRLFNLDHGVTVLKRSAQKRDIFLFATQRENHHMANWYLLNLNRLEYFIAQYKSLAHQHIKRMIQEPIVQIGKKLSETDTKPTPLAPRYYIYDGENAYLTPREFLVASMWLYGIRTKAIAAKLNISHKYVSSIKECIKHKMHVNRANEALSLLAKSDLAQLIYFEHLRHSAEQSWT